ncbi:sugar ABC transporter permease [Phyllobacterium sp. 21LDTY02-6]|uniref:carbohydrate ABC transporter permease n=1 Tax=Phyllobacterium sp. 21LDTY02-6 TaxID=2944903 RepID=UPI002020D7B7|nr:sugar ABC transporter permease [Phyllobacterium sp. 21LDTY02-6]
MAARPVRSRHSPNNQKAAVRLGGRLRNASMTTGIKRTGSLSNFADRQFHWLALAPACIFLVLLTVYPVLELIAMATSTITFERAREIWRFTPVENFRQLLDDDIFRIALKNTVVFALVSVVIEVCFGIGLAILVSSAGKAKAILRTILIIPILMPPVAIGSMWKLMYSLDFGVLNQAITLIGLPAVNWLGSTSLALLSVVIVDVWHWTPFVFLILLAAVEAIPNDVIEAARIDGASNRSIVFRIIIPLIWPTIVVALFFRTILAFKVFDQIFLLTSGGPGTSTEVVSLHLHKVYFQQNDLGFGSMLSLAVIAATVAFIWVAYRAGRFVRARDA